MCNVYQNSKVTKFQSDLLSVTISGPHGPFTSFSHEKNEYVLLLISAQKNNNNKILGKGTE